MIQTNRIEITEFARNLIQIFNELPPGRIISERVHQKIVNDYNIDLRLSQYQNITYKMYQGDAWGFRQSKEDETCLYYIVYLNSLRVDGQGFLVITPEEGCAILSPTNREEETIFARQYPCVYFDNKDTNKHKNLNTTCVKTKDTGVVYRRLCNYYQHIVYRDTLILESFPGN